MATYQTVDTYRDPVQVSVENLGNPQSYLQNQRDTNVLSLQKIVDEKVNTSLLRGIDQEYLYKRINSIVNYINQNGSTGWDNKDIVRGLQDSISSVIDKNVLNGMASTQAYQKQMAEIDQAKKDGKWALQNEWMATQDLQRYLSSNKIGDRYQAGTFSPYVDVKETILKHADKLLKDFGAEFVPYEGNSNGYFRYIGTKEVVSPEKVKQFLQTVLGPQELNQMFIDAQYTYKDYSEADLKSKYSNKLQEDIDKVDSAINQYKVYLGSATRSEKDKYNEQIKTLENYKSNLVKQQGASYSKQNLASALYQDNVMNAWTAALSYERVKDFKLDDSMFQLAKWEADKNLQHAKFKFDMVKHQDDMAYKQKQLDIEMLKAGMKYDKEGKLTKSGSGAGEGLNGKGLNDDGLPDGINISDVPNPQNKEEIKNPISKLQKNYNENLAGLTNVVGAYRDSLIKQAGNDKFSSQYGKVKPQTLASMLINSPSKTSSLFLALPPSVQEQVMNLRIMKEQLHTIDSNIERTYEDWSKVLKAVEGKSSTKDGFANGFKGMAINSKGQWVKGDVFGNNGKFNALNSFVGTYMMGRKDMTEDEKTAYNRMLFKKGLSLGMSDTELRKVLKAIQDYKGYEYNGRDLKTIGSDFVKGAGDIIGNLYESVSGESDDPWGSLYKGLGAWVKNTRNTLKIPFSYIGNSYNRAFSQNKDLESLGNKTIFGSSDLDESKLGFKTSQVLKRSQQNIQNAKMQVSKFYEKQLTRAVTIDLKSPDKDAKALISNIKAKVPPNIHVQMDGQMTLSDFDVNTNMATVTFTSKEDGKRVSVPMMLPINELPQAIRSKLVMGDVSTYSAKNQFAQTFHLKSDLPRDIYEVNQRIQQLPINQRYGINPEAFHNQTTVVKEILNMYGQSPELITANADIIKDILDADYQIKMIPQQGQWTLQLYKGNDLVIEKPTGQENYDPNLIQQTSNSIIRDGILYQIKNLMIQPTTHR